MDNHPGLLINEEKIAKYLSGESGPGEALALEEWMAADPANKVLFAQYLNAWNSFKVANKYKVPDTFKAWKFLQADLNSGNKAVNISVGVKRVFKRYSVAAFTLGMILLSAAIGYKSFRRDNNTVVKENEITYSAKGNIEKNILPDSSRVVLYSNSSLRFPVNFQSATRQTTLEGEAYFNVTPNPAKPFIISVGKIHIQVVGTSFNVKDNARDQTIETQVTTGKVRMYNSNGEILIVAGQTGIYNKADDRFSVKTNSGLNNIGYATRNFIFTDEKLSEVINYLEKAYSTKIILDNPLLGNCKLTAAFENKSIDYVVQVITTTLYLTHSIKNGVIHIGGNHEDY